MGVTRRNTLIGLGALGFVAAPRFGWAIEDAGVGIDYLEALGKPGALSERVKYLAPSQIDEAYSHVIYVNSAHRTPGAQKMWVIERDGDGWKLALWDEKYWENNGATPEYSWPVSTGRKYAGDSRSGPTPLGIFNADDRNHRHRRGWGSPGMYNSIYIDLHYRSGRASGVAMHGTTSSKYRKLGRADSHGCIRMTQANANSVWSMFHGEGRPGENSPLWSEVPRYFETPPARDRSARWGYVRDGTLLRDEETGEVLTKPGYSVLFVFFRDDL